MVAGMSLPVPGWEIGSLGSAWEGIEARIGFLSAFWRFGTQLGGRESYRKDLTIYSSF